MLRNLSLIIAVSLPILLAAQTDSIVTLEQCIEMAVANNAAMKTAANNTEAARQTRREAFTKYFPEISAQGFGFRTHNYVLQYNALDLLRIELIRHGMLAGVQALQPIFMGGQIVNGNQLAKVGEAVAELQQHQTENQVRLTAEKYYWQLATLKATRHTLSSALAMLDTLERQVSVAVKAGVVTNNELLKVQLQHNDFASKMVDLDNGIKLCRMVISQYVGAPCTSPIDIEAAVSDEVPPYPLDLRVDPATALPGTIDYQLLEANVKAKKLEKRMALGKNLPSVVGGAGWYYHNVLEQGHNFGALMLGINIPISGWWGGAHSMKRANLALKNAELERENLSEMLQIDMQNKWDELTAAHRKMEIAHEAIAQSAENLRLNEAFYAAGTGTITDLLDAQTLNRQACDSYISAFGDFCVARASYLNVTGR